MRSCESEWRRLKRCGQLVSLVQVIELRNDPYRVSSLRGKRQVEVCLEVRKTHSMAVIVYLEQAYNGLQRLKALHVARIGGSSRDTIHLSTGEVDLFSSLMNCQSPPEVRCRNWESMALIDACSDSGSATIRTQCYFSNNGAG